MSDTVSIVIAREWLEEARASHIAWRDHVAAHGPDCCDDPIRSLNWEREQEWIDRYDRLLVLLERVEQAADDSRDFDTLS